MTSTPTPGGSSNLTEFDYIIVQRGNSNFRISGDQILNFSMDKVQPKLDEIELALQLESAIRERNDNKTSDELDNLIQRLEKTINGLFPVTANIYYTYRIDYPANAAMASTYQVCAGQPISIYPRVNDEPLKCYDAAREDFHQTLSGSILNNPGSFFLSTHDLTIGAVDALYINRFSHGGADNSDLWTEENLLPGDLIQINAYEETAPGEPTIIDNYTYGIFEVDKVMGERLPINPGGGFDPDKSLWGVNLKYITGSDEGFFILNRRVQIRILKSVSRTLTEKFVEVEGDTMTGPLEIDLVDITSGDALTTNGNIHANTASLDKTLTMVEDSTGIIYTSNFTIGTESNAMVAFDDGSVGLLINADKGARYSSTIELDNDTQLTHKHYVDEANTDVRNDLDELSTRVEGLANLTKKVSSKFSRYEASESIPYTDWAADVVSNDGLEEKTFQMRGTGTNFPPTYTEVKRVLIHENCLPDDTYLWITNVITNDLLEITHTPTDTTPDGTQYHYVMYNLVPDNEGDPVVIEHTLSDGRKAYELLVNFNRSSGGAGIFDETYDLVAYDRNTGLSLEDTDERYVNIIGDTMEGNLLIDYGTAAMDANFQKGTANSLTYYELTNSGSANLRGSLEIGYLNTSDKVSINIPGDGNINFGTVGLGDSGPVITVSGQDRITLGTQLSLHDKVVTDLQDPRQGSTGETDAVNRKWFTNNIVTDSDTEIVVTTDNDGRVTLTKGGVSLLSKLEDTDITQIVADIPEGAVVKWNRNDSKWQAQVIGENYGPGDNIFAESEDDCKVGGLWTDKKDNPDSPGYYIRVK